MQTSSALNIIFLLITLLYDFALQYFIRELVITNRGDNCCIQRLSNFEIRIGLSLVNNGNENPTCGGKHSLKNVIRKKIVCSPSLLGRYVNIVIPNAMKVLTLCEVEVYPWSIITSIIWQSLFSVHGADWLVAAREVRKKRIALVALWEGNACFFGPVRFGGKEFWVDLGLGRFVGKVQTITRPGTLVLLLWKAVYL